MKHCFSMIVKVLTAILLMAAASSCASAIYPDELKTEYMAEPNSVDVSAPRLSWINFPADEEVKGERQTAWQVRVATSENGLRRPDLWDSGKVMSDDSYLVPYQGKALASGTDCWWQVRVWDSEGRASGWSRPAHWVMGIMDGQWQAEWIGAPWQTEESDGGPGLADIDDKPAPMFRKSFRLERKPVSAKAFVTGLGYFELYANGRRIGEECLAPNFTNYTYRPGLKENFISVDGDRFSGYTVMYLVHDLTDVLEKGDNAIGVLVGNGWYNTHGRRWSKAYGSPRMICQVHLTYSDGTVEIMTSDTSWKVKRSAIVMNDEYRGEVYDANLEDAGWCEARYDDSQWEDAVERMAPLGKMKAHTAPLDKVTDVLEPVSFERTDEGFVVDFGKEVSGWIRFRNVSGRKGDTLRVHYLIDQPVADQLYVFSDKPCADYAPKFAWYVFSRALITGVEELEADNVRAEMVNTHVEPIAEFESSNELFERFNEMWRLTQLDNMHGGVASDCPHREKSPYTGDGQVVCQTVMSNFDAAAFYRKWIRDIRDSQNAETGYVPNGAPWQPGCGGGVAWGAAMNIMPWEFYRHYGDRDFLAENYEAMKAQVRYMTTWLTKDGTMLSQVRGGNSDEPNYWANLGEWCAPYSLPAEELVHTFYLWLCADITARAAEALDAGDGEEFRALASDVKAAFHKKFYNPQTCSYGRYGSNVFALYMGVPEELRAGVVESLKEELEANGARLNTGIFATRYLLEVLAANGLNDLAYEIMTAEEYPGFGHWAARGATTFWEQWDGLNSRNHPMFGGCLTWFPETLAGINIDERSPGYKHVIIRPVLASKLESVSWSSMTPYGMVKSAVRHKDGKAVLNVTIPVGSTATVYLPGASEGIEIEQGTYSFAALMGLAASAQPESSLRPDVTVLLYGTELVDNVDPVVGGKIVSAGFEMAEDNGLAGPERLGFYGDLYNTNVNARVDLYFPDKPNGQMIVVCPGGGYYMVGTYYEGLYIAEWMLSQGITVAVVKYRLPNGHCEVPLTDVQNAFRYCRTHASEWGVRQIGVIGCSAGGQLAASVSTLFVDDVTRPDFSVLVYPVITMEKGITDRGTCINLLGDESLGSDRSKSVFHRFSLENQVTERTPPTFMVHSGNDTVVPVENTLRYYGALVEHGVPAEIHIYQTGDHGWGFLPFHLIGQEGNGDRFRYGRDNFNRSLSRWLESLR